MDIISQAFVLRQIKYNDRYNILDLYTKDLGKCTALVSIPKGKRSNSKMNFYQPLFLLDINLYRKSNKGFFKIKDVRFSRPYTSIPYDPYKMSLVFFLSEIIFNVVKEDVSNEYLFLYIHNSLIWLDECRVGYANFHIVFLIKLLLFLGLYPNVEEYTEGDYFDMRNAVFCRSKPNEHNQYIIPQEAKNILYLSRMSYKTMHLFKMSRLERGQILDYIISYYKIHIPGVSDLKSLDVLKELFS